MKIVLVGLATLLLAPGTLAVATLIDCADPCVVESSLSGFSPPVVVIESGQSVQWDAIDISHVQSDQGVGRACFAVTSTVVLPSSPVTFSWSGAELTAQVGDAEPAQCDNAVSTAEGAILHYRCLLHSNMHGAILVHG